MVKPRQIGLTEAGKFYPCYPKHVCVSTQAPKDDEMHYIEPITLEGSKSDAIEKILSYINSFKRTKIVEQKENYIHATFTTFLFRFTDDVEFLVDEGNKIIHFRSQSRIGGYDWGTNRKRMEKFRDYFIEI